MRWAPQSLFGLSHLVAACTVIRGTAAMKCHETLFRKALYHRKFEACQQERLSRRRADESAAEYHERCTRHSEADCISQCSNGRTSRGRRDRDLGASARGQSLRKSAQTIARIAGDRDKDRSVTRITFGCKIFLAMQEAIQMLEVVEKNTLPRSP
jgi:hypothetical protein